MNEFTRLWFWGNIYLKVLCKCWFFNIFVCKHILTFNFYETASGKSINLQITLKGKLWWLKNFKRTTMNAEPPATDPSLLPELTDREVSTTASCFWRFAFQNRSGIPLILLGLLVVFLSLSRRITGHYSMVGHDHDIYNPRLSKFIRDTPRIIQHLCSGRSGASRILGTSEFVHTKEFRWNPDMKLQPVLCHLCYLPALFFRLITLSLLQVKIRCGFFF